MLFFVEQPGPTHVFAAPLMAHVLFLWLCLWEREKTGPVRMKQAWACAGLGAKGSALPSTSVLNCGPKGRTLPL